MPRPQPEEEQVKVGFQLPKKYDDWVREMAQRQAGTVSEIYRRLVMASIERETGEKQ